MRRPGIVVLAALLAAGLPASGGAHAFLDHASPAVGSTVARAPAALELSFTEQLEPAFSTVEVDDAHGQRVDGGNPHPAADDPSELVVTLPELPPGEYHVRWRVQSVDTHVTHGEFSFRVAP